MPHRPPPRSLLKKPSPIVPAPSEAAGTTPPSPAAEPESPPTASSAASAAPAPTRTWPAHSLPSLVLAVPTVEQAKQLMIGARAWVVDPEHGKGEVSIRVVVDPEVRQRPDATWLEAQVELQGLGTFEPARLIWSDPDDQRP